MGRLEGVGGMTYPTRDELFITRNRGLSAVDRMRATIVIEPNGCWRWTKGLTTSGYGHLSIRGVYYQAHLLVYIWLVGPLPDGLEPDHLRRNRWCVNAVKHIEFVTHAVNMQRGTVAALTSAQVAAVRRARRNGAGVRALAREYGVNHSTISRLVNGLTWAEPIAAEAVA